MDGRDIQHGSELRQRQVSVPQTDTDRKRTLEDVREAIAENDALRLDSSLNEDVRLGLEKTALTLRDLERELIESSSEAIVDRLEAASKSIEDLARDIRARVTEMNAAPKALEHIKKVLSMLTRFLAELARW